MKISYGYGLYVHGVDFIIKKLKAKFCAENDNSVKCMKWHFFLASLSRGDFSYTDILGHV